MPRLSNDPLNTFNQRASNEKFMPFTAYGRLVPTIRENRRDELIGAMRTLSRKIEDDLQTAGMTDYSSTAHATINVAAPIATTPQFGNFTARATITGFFKTSNPNVMPTTDKTVITQETAGNPTGTMTGPSNSSILADGDTTTVADTAATAIKDALEAASTELEIYRLDYNGVIYGEGGRTFS